MKIAIAMILLCQFIQMIGIALRSKWIIILSMILDIVFILLIIGILVIYKNKSIK
jgi:hypothetical protein